MSTPTCPICTLPLREEWSFNAGDHLACPTHGFVRELPTNEPGVKVLRDIAVRFVENENEPSIEIVISNLKTHAQDRFILKVDEQGSTYTMLLSAITKDRRVGRASVRELIQNIGDQDFDT